MENQNRTMPVAVAVGLIALLLGLCCGLTVGIVGGYFIGHGAAPRAMEDIVPNPTVEERSVSPEMPAAPGFTGREALSGAVIGEVIAGSPAERAGVAVGDIVVQVDGTPIDEAHRLADVIGQYEPGQRIEITVLRLGQTKTLKVTLGANEKDAKRPYLGVRYSDSSPLEPTPTPGK